jgi:hypothetical protein
LAIVAEKATAKPKPAVDGRAVRLGHGLRFTVKDDGPIDFATHPGECEGKRNDALCRLAGVHLSRGDSLATIEALALAWAKRCNPPCEAEGVVRRVRDLAKKDAKADGGFASKSPSVLESNAKDGMDSKTGDRERGSANPPSLSPLPFLSTQPQGKSIGEAEFFAGLGQEGSTHDDSWETDWFDDVVARDIEREQKAKAMREGEMTQAEWDEALTKALTEVI